MTRGYWVRSTVPREQAREVLERFDLRRNVAPFIRCLVCNGMLRSVPFEEVKTQLLPGTARAYREFWRCEQCSRVYWKGPHYRRLEALAQELLSEGARDERRANDAERSHLPHSTSRLK